MVTDKLLAKCVIEKIMLNTKYGLCHVYLIENANMLRETIQLNGFVVPYYFVFIFHLKWTLIELLRTFKFEVFVIV